MFGVYVPVLLFALTLVENVLSSPCVAFDISDTLLVFGLGGKDWDAGTQGNWTTNVGATDITKSGRPPFDGIGTTCYLAEYFNAIYVMNGDKSNPTHIHIYDATAKSWSTQVTTPGSFDYSSMDAILDHDTNVFYAISNGSMYSLDFGPIKQVSINSRPAWNDIQKLPFADGYKPVMALAQNHIHFLDVPGLAPGQASIFVIHYNWYQPNAQSYPAPNNVNFPLSYGQATSFFQSAGVQEEFAFIPDDFSGTYVVNVEKNTTQVLPAPTIKDTKATYFAGIKALAQLDSQGVVSFFLYEQGNQDANARATWGYVNPITIVYNPPGASRPSPSLTSASVHPSSSAANNSSSTSTTNQASAINQVIPSLVAMFCVITTASLL